MRPADAPELVVVAAAPELELPVAVVVAAAPELELPVAVVVAGVKTAATEPFGFNCFFTTFGPIASTRWM
jgi:hypothetical protein